MFRLLSVWVFDCSKAEQNKSNQLSGGKRSWVSFFWGEGFFLGEGPGLNEPGQTGGDRPGG